MKLHKIPGSLRVCASALAAAVLACGLLTGCGGTEEETEQITGSNVLYVYNWGEYIDEDVIGEFEEETGIKVVYDLFETNEEMYPVIEAGGVVYDVVCPSDYMIQKMIEHDLLQEINFDHIPNIENIDEKYMEFSRFYDPENKYSVPYCWGTVGIIYNADVVTDEVDSWSILWDEKYKDEVLMQDSVRDAFMVGQKLLGYSTNSTDEEELKKVTELMIEQKPLVQAYVVDQVRDKMIGGEAQLAVIYSGELLYIREVLEEDGSDMNLRYVIPKEGTNVWLDSWVIPKNAKHKENAEKWIDFLCRPDIAERNFWYIGYPTPNKGAFELLDEEMQNDLEIFPSDEMLENSEVFQFLGDEADKMYNHYWKILKSY